MANCEPMTAEAVKSPVLSWKPICCRQEMLELVRRLVFQNDGRVVQCSVWSCSSCGRTLL